MELQFNPDPTRKLSTDRYDTYLCWVGSEYTPDDGQGKSPKHIDFYAKINCETIACSWFYYKENCQTGLLEADNA